MNATTRATEEEIKQSYEGQEFAEKYIERRFVNEMHRMLHCKQVRAIQDVIGNCDDAKRILEVAPGPGRLTRDVVFVGQRICLEYNQGMIDVGREACDSRIEWIQGNAFELPVDGAFSNPFDVAYTFRFIRHFKTDDRNRLYEQLHRVIRPDGYLVFDAVNAVVSRPLRDANPDEYPIYDVLYDDIAQLRDELKEAGFELLKHSPVQKAVHWQSKSQNLIGPRSRLINRMVINAFEKFSHGPPLEWIITCRRA